MRLDHLLSKELSFLKSSQLWGVLVVEVPSVYLPLFVVPGGHTPRVHGPRWVVVVVCAMDHLQQSGYIKQKC